MRNLVVLLVLLAMTGVSSYAQDETPRDSRTLQFYMEANSGTVGDSDQKLWSGNCIDVGVNYSHKFGNIPWMTLTSKVRWIAKQNGAYDSDENYMGNSTTASSVDANSFRARVGLSFSTPIGVGISTTMDTRGLMTLNASYSIKLGSAGTIGLGIENCLYAIPKAKTSDTTATGYDGVTVMELSSFDIGYTTPVFSNWSFRTRARFQISGSGFERDDVIISEKFRVRWENTVYYNPTSKVGLWGQVRTQFGNVANPDKDLETKVYLRAGINYRFDMSGL